MLMETLIILISVDIADGFECETYVIVIVLLKKHVMWLRRRRGDMQPKLSTSVASNKMSIEKFI